MFEIVVPEYRSIDIIELLSGEITYSDKKMMNNLINSLLSVLQCSGAPSTRRFILGDHSTAFHELIRKLLAAGISCSSPLRGCRITSSSSFPRKRESGILLGFWVPACAGTTTKIPFCDSLLRERIKVSREQQNRVFDPSQLAAGSFMCFCFFS